MEEKNTQIYSMDEALPSLSELIALVDDRKFQSFVQSVSEIPAPDVAAYFDELPREYIIRFFRLLPKGLAADSFVEMDSEHQEYLINSFTDSELSEVLSELYLDDTVDIIEEMPASVVKRIIKNSSKQNRGIINELLRYPKDSAGSIMTTEYVRLTGNMTVERALAHIRKVAIDKETVYTCYITDENRKLLGFTTVKQMLLASLDTKISDIFEENVIFIKTTDDREEAAQKFEKYGLIAMPVVDNEMRLVGIITFDDAIDVLKEETEEDFAKMAAVTPTEKSYLKTSTLEFFRARIPWLLLLMISATFSSAILNSFEALLPAVLILFVPMLMGTGGNSGGQAAVTVIRGISLGELEFSDFFRVLLKEIKIGALSGAALGAASFLKVIFIDKLIMQNPDITVPIAIIISVTLALTILASKILGATLPLFVKKIGLDPAVMASPFITTLLDIISLLLYLFVASSLI
jgi:magnesium transporter